MFAFLDRTKFVPLWRIFGDIFLEGVDQVFFLFLVNKFINFLLIRSIYFITQNNKYLRIFLYLKK